MSNQGIVSGSPADLDDVAQEEAAIIMATDASADIGDVVLEEPAISMNTDVDSTADMATSSVLKSEPATIPSKDASTTEDVTTLSSLKSEPDADTTDDVAALSPLESEPAIFKSTDVGPTADVATVSALKSEPATIMSTDIGRITDVDTVSALKSELAVLNGRMVDVANTVNTATHEGEISKASSIKSLAISTTTALTPSTSVGTKQDVDSPQSQVSRPKGLQLSEQRMSICSDKKSRRESSHSSQNSNDSLNSDDGFHQPTQHTVIIPKNTVQQASYPTSVAQIVGSHHKITGRFSVSPSQSIPVSVSSRRKYVGKTPSHSVGSRDSFGNLNRESVEPETQFNMSEFASDMSIPMDPDMECSLGQRQPLLDDNVSFATKSVCHILTEPTSKGSDSTLHKSMEIDLDDILKQVDENQQTLQSGYSVNTQDSATYGDAPLQCGNIRFVKNTTDMIEVKKHYMCVGLDTPMHRVTDFMSKYWGMRNPKIVLSIISSVDNFKPWKNQRLKDDFQKGIIKAANTTEMWIITNGIDAGVTKMIGDVVREYNIEHQNSRIVTNPVISSEELRRKRLTIMGIVPKESVPYGLYFDGSEGVDIKNLGQKQSDNVYELNPDHSHFIMVEEDGRDTFPVSLRCLIEKQFRNKSGSRKRKHLMSIVSEEYNDDQKEGNKKLEDPENFIPVVGLLVQGAPRDVDHVLYYLQNKMPVVVLKGSGGIADMIVYAYEEMQEKGDADPDYEDNFLKPDLIKMITKVYASYFEDNEMGKFALRDKILQSVKIANEQGEGDNSFITIVNMKGWGSSLRDLDKYILRALFKSKRHELNSLQEQLQNDLQLTIDWNKPDLAWEIFQHDVARVRIDKKMFEQSLLQKDREEFINLFLSQGVKVHKFLNHKKLKLLFEKAEDREFFENICLEGVLGISAEPGKRLEDSFLSENLNRLIYKLAWIRNFVQPYELSMSSSGLYEVNATIAERKALNMLIIWAILMNRHKLAKTLWNRCDEPIGVALICSRISRELSRYKMEQYQREELEQNAKEFGQMALGALAICWRDSSIQAYNMLGKQLPDFNNKSVIEIAHDAGYIHFLAHPCCQKWLTKTFFGHLQVKELRWGFFRLPDWFKILASAFLIFPMYIWITFIAPKRKKTNIDHEDEFADYNEESESEDDEEDPHLLKSSFDKGMSQGSAIKMKLKMAFSFDKPLKEVPFHTKIYLLWTAPITKFWTTQTFYFGFLGVFCLATLWPTCGNQYLDLVLWFWTAIIEMELVCRVYRKYHKYETLSLVGNCIDIFVIMTFLVLLLLTRILHVWVSITNYIQAKTFMCFGLIYFFYRLLGVYLPISPTLGPMLLRMNRMVKNDFVAFIRMFMIFMIVGGVTIQAVIYPNWPLNNQLIKRVITRPIYAMFLTQIQDLDGDPTCSDKYENLSTYCSTGRDLFYKENGKDTGDNLAESLSECPHSSFSGYLITLQYLLICKLVLVTLLFAMFALTIGKVDMEASQIWKFQRYALIADFIERFSLPPPFTLFSFIYLIIKCIGKRLWTCKRRIQGLSTCCYKNKKHRPKNRVKHVIDDTVFWKRVAREYVASEEAKAEKENIPAQQGDILVSLQEDLRSHRKSMKRLNDRVVELERMIQSSRLYLEDIAHKLEKSDVMGITNVKGHFIHVVARQSPYPGTRITRFPVFDKYVPWEVLYDVYDPKTFTLKKEEFPEAEIMYVDEDINELQRKREERSALTDDDITSRLSPIVEFSPKWNSVVTFKENGERREIDRRSWINFDNQPLRYTIDTLGIPQNPLGRTGMRGKGNLWRWGPNHVIKAVVTRWRRKYSSDINLLTDYLYVDGKRVLEFIAVQKDSFTDTSYCLPGNVLHGMSSPYSVLCKAFMTEVFDEQDVDHFEKLDQAEMIQFFAQFACTLIGASSSTSVQNSAKDGYVSSFVRRMSVALQPFKSESRSSLRTEADNQGFSASLLYKGYLDDPRNTDNAWVEAEVWNFHYDVGDTFDIEFTEESSVKWKEVSPYVKMFGNETVIVQEAARIHDAYH